MSAIEMRTIWPTQSACYQHDVIPALTIELETVGPPVSFQLYDGNSPQLSPHGAR